MSPMGFQPEEPLPCPAFTNRTPESTLKDEEWKHRSPYTMQTEAELGPIKWRGKCLCGKVTYALKREKPLNAKYCHCRGCQVAHGAPLQWAVIFHKNDMSFINGSSGLVFYSSTHQSQEYGLPTKVYCENCRTPIMDEGRNVCLIFPQLMELEGSSDEQRQKREPLKPTYVSAMVHCVGFTDSSCSCHIFYETRTTDIPDGLPKWRGMENASDRLDDQGNQIDSPSR
ncbi:unnamed protein product [Penicillium salamii]|uniref:CENP-V/GFA domain-containing protein n=1 Tax=Penicillium salamii TaxID=1612424 RepID=A0A9W4N2A2_9EURO|nr:unnamed protein product [Penicillium salamii]CAG7962605.1 unnamed protein product [Penicillium salamii]CAG7966041.1 unnamed protein product [Penicillium salamii]CAG7983870.1 unnamed protein product [Penicillium salamii]CAG8124665.1 unnamed protein product [Penicillium salamii]